MRNKAVHLADGQAVGAKELEADVKGFDVELDRLFVVPRCMAFATMIKVRHAVAIAASRSESVEHLQKT